MKPQIWIAVSVYVQMAIIRKRLNIGMPQGTMLEIFSVTEFDKLSLEEALLCTELLQEPLVDQNHPNPFEG